MKIVHIASGDLWAGAEKQLYMLACALQQLDGLDVAVVLFNRGQLADNLAAAGIDVTVFEESTHNAWSLFRQIRQLLGRLRPDIVHTHRNKENIIGGLAATSLGIPSLRTSHGSPEHPAGLFDLRRRILRMSDYLTGRLLQRRVVAVSRPLQEELVARFGKRRVALIHNGLDIADAPAARQRGRAHCWRIGIVGRLVPVKRVDLFINIAAELDRHLDPAINARFAVIGDGPLRADLECQAASRQWRRPLEFTGHLADAEKAIGALDILVICSDHEGLPMVALEAFKAGTAVVTHRIGGLVELLDDGSAGFLVDGQNAKAFAERIEAAISDPAALERRTATAAERLALRYSATTMASHYAALYRSICT